MLVKHPRFQDPNLPMKSPSSGSRVGPPPYTWVGLVLNAVLSLRHLTLNALAQAANVDQSNLSKSSRGNLPLSESVLRQLLSAFPKKEDTNIRHAIVWAHYLDMAGRIGLNEEDVDFVRLSPNAEKVRAEVRSILLHAKAAAEKNADRSVRVREGKSLRKNQTAHGAH